MTDIFNFNDPQAFIDLAQYVKHARTPVRVCVLDPMAGGLTIRYANVSLSADHPVWTWDPDADVPGMQPGEAERAARAPIVSWSWPEHDGRLTHPVDALTILSALTRRSRRSR